MMLLSPRTNSCVDFQVLRGIIVILQHVTINSTTLANFLGLRFQKKAKKIDLGIIKFEFKIFKLLGHKHDTLILVHLFLRTMD